MGQALNPSAEARRLVESGKFQILSLDVFDTAVWRSFPAPGDLFFALGHDLLRDKCLLPSSSPSSFALERIEAEREARSRQVGSGEVTLEEIYAAFPPGYLRAPATEVLQRELALESGATHRDAEIFALIECAERRGMRVAFVSDTYFDESHLSAILGRKKYIFPSSRYRRSKVQGLHRELIRSAGVEPSQILHIGDNYEADAEAPSRWGIHTVWRPRIPDGFKTAVSLELPSSRSARAGYFSAPSGDGGLTALRMQASTAADTGDDPFRAWGALVLGPIAAGFGKWVIERCREEGIGTALCLMREGRALKRVIDSFGSGLATDELFVSRYAVMRASMFEGTEAELAGYLTRPTPLSAAELLLPLGIDPGELDLDAETLVGHTKTREVASKIARNPALRTRAVQSCAKTRRNFVAYLKATVPQLPERVAVVDLGYSGTIQRHLQAIFDHEGIACRAHGLYLVTGSGIRTLQRQGGRAEGFLAENGQPLSVAHSFMRSPELVEQSLMCSMGSTVDYVDEAPVLGELRVPEEQIAQIERVQQGIFDFVQRFAGAPAIQTVTAAALRPFLEAILIRAVTSPCEEELQTFGGWMHDENMGSVKTRPLIGADIDERCLAHASAHQLASLSNAVSHWIFATASQQHARLGEAVRNIYLRSTTAETYHCPESERTLSFFWNDGEAHRADKSYHLSSRRTAWTRFSLQVRNADLLEVGFSAGRPGDIISLAGIVLRLRSEGNDSKVVDLPLADLQSFGTERVKGTSAAYLVTEIPGFVAPVPDIRNFTGSVDVDLLFSQLPTGELCPC